MVSTQESKAATWLPTVLVAFLFGVSPFMIHLRPTNLLGSEHPYLRSLAIVSDYYTWYRGLALMAIGAVTLGYLVWQWRSMRELWREQSLALSFIAMAAVWPWLSLISASGEARVLAFWGIPGEFGGAPVFSTYMLLIILGRQLQPKHWSFIAAAAGMAVTVAALLGVLRQAGFEVFGDTFKSLVVGSTEIKYVMLRAAQRFALIAGNANIAGHWSSLLIPVFAGLALTDSIRRRWLWLSFLTASWTLLIGSQTRIAMAATGVLFLVWLALLRWRQSVSNVMALGVLGPVVAAALLVSLTDADAYKKSLETFTDETPSNVDATARFTRLESVGAALIAEAKGAAILLQAQANGLTVFDGQGRVVPLTPSREQIFQLDRPEYRHFQFEILPEQNLQLVRLSSGSDGITLIITADSPPAIRVFDRGNSFAAVTAAKWPPSLRDGFLTGRGYIWSRTLPLLLEKPFVGHGTGNFTTDFPQRDFLGKIRFAGTHERYITKPHSLYLQVAHGFGFVGLVFIVGSILIVLIHMLRSVTRSENIILQSSFLVALCTYLAVAIGNDAHVLTAAMACCLLGIGWSYSNKDTNKEHA